MQKLTLLAVCIFSTFLPFAQAPKTELYDLIKKLVCDSSGYENVGDWAVGQPSKFPIAWKADRLEMSEDTSINFYRLGTANITIGNRHFTQAEKPVTWNIMLKGARSGFSSFSILSTPSKNILPKLTVDSLFGSKPYNAKLQKSCDANAPSGYYYYEVKLPKKDVEFIKISWLSLNGNTALRIDGYNSWSQYAAKLACR